MFYRRTSYAQPIIYILYQVVIVRLRAKSREMSRTSCVYQCWSKSKHANLSTGSVKQNTTKKKKKIKKHKYTWINVRVHAYLRHNIPTSIINNKLTLVRVFLHRYLPTKKKLCAFPKWTYSKFNLKINR